MLAKLFLEPSPCMIQVQPSQIWASSLLNKTASPKSLSFRARLNLLESYQSYNNLHLVLTSKTSIKNGTFICSCSSVSRWCAPINNCVLKIIFYASLESSSRTIESMRSLHSIHKSCLISLEETKATYCHNFGNADRKVVAGESQYLKLSASPLKKEKDNDHTPNFFATHELFWLNACFNCLKNIFLIEAFVSFRETKTTVTHEIPPSHQSKDL